MANGRSDCCIDCTCHKIKRETVFTCTFKMKNFLVETCPFEIFTMYPYTVSTYTLDRTHINSEYHEVTNRHITRKYIVTFATRTLTYKKNFKDFHALTPAISHTNTTQTQQRKLEVFSPIILLAT